MASDKEQAGDHADEIEPVEEKEAGQKMTDKILKCSNMMTASQSQRIADKSANLPSSVKRRIKALKKLQLETINIEAKFLKEVHELKCKYHQLYIPFYEKRDQIVNGTHVPTEEECKCSSDEKDDISNELKERTEIQNKEIDSNIRGIPDFWLTVFKNCSILTEIVEPHDEPILKYLTDIKSTCKTDPMEFNLDFCFAPNEYFTNTVLTKQYVMKCVPDDYELFSFEGPGIYKCTGSVINWNKGKNVTLKTVELKSRSGVRTVTKTFQNDSFFNFFNPPTIPEKTNEEINVDKDSRTILISDFEIGLYIRGRIIPRAVLYFTGEGIDDEKNFEEEEDENGKENENDSDEDIEENKMNEKDPNCERQ